MEYHKRLNDSSNSSLHRARRVKEDEFYTDLADIERELPYYAEEFRGKTVYCNCDDPYRSNFVRFFLKNFNSFGLKRLICTCYRGYDSDGIQMTLDRWDSIPESYQGVAYLLDIDHLDDGFEGTDLKKELDARGIVTTLKGSGDFRSQECVDFLNQADIVVSNPPFSLFRQYFTQLMQFNKKFLIIGNKNAVTYKEIFSYVKQNKVWLGRWTKGMSFKVVEGDLEHRANRSMGEDGHIWQKLGFACWFTNMGSAVKDRWVDLTETYDSDAYPEYDNFNAIEVSRVKDIPKDYFGIMGVPITFMEVYSPEQFEIVGHSASHWRSLPEALRISDYDHRDLCINATPVFKRIFIRRIQEKTVYDIS